MDPTSAYITTHIGTGFLLDWDWVLCGGGGVTPRHWLGQSDAIAALESKAALGFTIPTNPTRDHMTTNINIGAGSALVLIPWDWKLCKGRGDSWQSVIQINVTTTTALES
jgi:hypothetical protein